jgi:Tfp pilus assembly PilM family ATPase
LLDPLDEELGGLGEVSAPAKSPFAGETSTRSIREVLSAPLARMVSEIRRSFDFFEHQLYERPVERIILSGGAAHLPLVGETLSEELGVETVEVADPATSELILSDEPSLAALREHPAQFLVAIGLAARGMADL